jgi:hypothetical protein
LLSTIRASGREVTISPPLPETKETTYKFRLAVKDGWFRAFVDGREIASEKIGSNPEPWLMLHSSHLNTADIHNVTINGSPTVPEKIDLLANDDLGMWRPYLGSIAGRIQGGANANGWEKRGEEIHEAGQKPEPPDEGKPIPPRVFPESAIYYQRPLIEDGTIDYEFFYEPDKALVHPMLDRLVFLLEPGGVKLHYLTDGINEKGGVSFDNAKDEPAYRRGPARLSLKEKAWNQVRVAVAGSTVKVSLNGTEVYERPIESTNQRLFGLFHYTDMTEARARLMIFSGNWSKTLPANDKLFEKK